MDSDKIYKALWTPEGGDVRDGAPASLPLELGEPIEATDFALAVALGGRAPSRESQRLTALEWLRRYPDGPS